MSSALLVEYLMMLIVVTVMTYDDTWEIISDTRGNIASDGK
jgi:hypothetical protein